MDEQELREVAARALIVAGVGKSPGDDIDAVTEKFRKQGVQQEGRQVRLLHGQGVSVRGKERVQVTTSLHIDQERELIRLAKTAAADKSAALPAETIERAIARFLEQRHPGLQETPQAVEVAQHQPEPTPASQPSHARAPAAEHWQAQRRMMFELGTGGRLAVGIGVAGSGKSTALAPLVEAWKAEGRQVYGISLAWRQAADLRSVGIEERASIAAFMRRVELGRYELDRNSIVVVDEVGLVGTKQMLDLLRVQERTGAQFVMIGNPKQCQSIDAGPVIDLLREALGYEAIPQILTSVRQKTEREREITSLFRAGHAAEALAMKQEDGTAILVAGGREATVAEVARLHAERLAANRDDPDFTLTISAPTNTDAREIGAAIRGRRRQADQLGPDVKTIEAIDRTGENYNLPLAIGDRVRLFDRVRDEQDRRIVLASNGETVEICGFTHDGMRVRNNAGTEGLVAWRQLQQHPGAPVRLTYGWASTIDVVQGSTATEHISVMPSGSRELHGLKGYVAASRHRRANFMVVDDAAERQQLAGKAMLGHRHEIGEQDVWRNVAENLSRQPLKVSALAMLQRASPRPRL
jgi:hypothetical protein